MKIRFFCLLSVVAVVVGGCGTSGESGGGTMRIHDAIHRRQVREHFLETDLKRLDSLTEALKDMAGDMLQLQRAIDSSGQTHYTSDQHDQIEHQLFRFLMCRETLWEMVDFHRDFEKHFDTEEERTKSFVIGFAAASQLCYYSSLMVSTFLDSPRTIAKLNEAYHRSEIPKGTYDTIFLGLTDPDNIKALRAARQIYSEELRRPGSPLLVLGRDDPEYRKLIVGIETIHEDGVKQVEDIMKRRSLLLPSVRNALRHSEINKIAQLSLRQADNAMYAIRGLTFTNFSRLKRPGSPPIELTPKQILEMKKLLEPGDVILTYSSGYMSNLFLPGKFKHGITYVGSVDERKRAGLERMLEGKSGAQREKLLKHLNTTHIADGSEANLVEALAEGVIFSSLDHLLTARMNRLVVWRPALTKEQRISDLASLFGYLGCAYDFKFDFSDATYQCCTEAIYRSLHRVGAIDFQLTKRMGRPTLSADDLCLYALDKGDQAFSFIVLAIPDERTTGHRARLLTGSQGITKLQEIMEL